MKIEFKKYTDLTKEEVEGVVRLVTNSFASVVHTNYEGANIVLIKAIEKNEMKIVCFISYHVLSKRNTPFSSKKIQGFAINLVMTDPEYRRKAILARAVMTIFHKHLGFFYYFKSFFLCAFVLSPRILRLIDKSAYITYPNEYQTPKNILDFIKSIIRPDKGYFFENDSDLIIIPNDYLSYKNTIFPKEKIKKNYLTNDKKYDNIFLGNMFIQNDCGDWEITQKRILAISYYRFSFKFIKVLAKYCYKIFSFKK